MVVRQDGHMAENSYQCSMCTAAKLTHLLRLCNQDCSCAWATHLSLLRRPDAWMQPWGSASCPQALPPGAGPGKCPRADSAQTGGAGVRSDPGDWSLDAILVCLTADHYPGTAIAAASGQAP